VLHALTTAADVRIATLASTHVAHRQQNLLAVTPAARSEPQREP
jgi:hypothetical protein